jgi:tetratricopeptide (TPR) repeat protein
MSPRHLLPLILLTLACDRQPATQAVPEPESPLAGARLLLQQGKLDEALAELQGFSQSSEALYLQGVVWARKAKSAPPPTPPPPPSPKPRRFKPLPAPEFKHEELLALELFDQSLSESPDSWPVLLATADLLAPHAERLFDQQKEAAENRRRPAPPAPQEDGPDYSPERVIELYTRAMGVKGSAATVVERQIEFALRVEVLDAADAAHLELIERDPEAAGPLVRYGDFLRDLAGDPRAALGRYQQAMIWAPDDDEIRKSILRLYITWGEEHYEKLERIGAERNFLEAKKYVKDWNSPEGSKVSQYLEKFRARR